MLVLVDTGILLRLFEANDPQHGVVRGALRILRARGDTLVIAAQNAAEFWNVCTRPVTARGGLGLSVADADRRLRIVEQLFRVIPDRAAAYQVWRHSLVAHGVQGVQVHDARLVALMQLHGISHVLTLNGSDFARYTGVVPIAPLSLLPPPQASP
jgi:predicted nucleic acid-binding protein